MAKKSKGKKPSTPATPEAVGPVDKSLTIRAADGGFVVDMSGGKFGYRSRSKVVTGQDQIAAVVKSFFGGKKK